MQKPCLLHGSDESQVRGPPTEGGRCEWGLVFERATDSSLSHRFILFSHGRLTRDAGELTHILCFYSEPSSASLSPPLLEFRLQMCLHLYHLVPKVLPTPPTSHVRDGEVSVVSSIVIGGKRVGVEGNQEVGGKG